VSTTNNSTPNPMIVNISAGGLVPAGNYQGRFVGIDYLPETDGDPQTGKGARKYAAYRFKWEITEGEHQGKIVNTDTPVSQGIKSRYIQSCGWLLPSLTNGSDLSVCVGKLYLLTIGSRAGSTWLEVTNAMLLPNQ